MITRPHPLFHAAGLGVLLAGLAVPAAPQTTSAAANRRTLSLRNVPVTGTLSDGGTFRGTLSVTRFGYDQASGLVVDGVVAGTARSAGGTTSQVNQTFTGVKASLNEIGLPPIPSLGTGNGAGGTAAAPTPRPTPAATITGVAPAAAAPPVASQQATNGPECDILHLDLGPIHLDLLGLQLDLSQVVLDLTAVSGAGNLLGNLLCAVAGLLDPLGNLTDITNFLNTLSAQLQQLNGLLG